MNSQRFWIALCAAFRAYETSPFSRACYILGWFFLFFAADNEVVLL